MKHVKNTMLAIGLIASSSIASGATEPVQIRGLGGGPSIARDINDLGQVVGEATTLSGGSSQAFVWENGVLTNLDSRAVGNSTAWGINDLGQVVGTTDRVSDGLRSAMLWSGGVETNIADALGATSNSVAWDTNHAGHIVGQATIGGLFSRGYRYEEGAGLLAFDDDSNFDGSAYMGVNEAGIAVGHQFRLFQGSIGVASVPDGSGGFTRNFELPRDPGPVAQSFGMPANERGVIAGFANDGFGPVMATIWTPEPITPPTAEAGVTIRPTVLGTLEAFNGSEAYDINDLGLVVGKSFDDALPDPRATVWIEGEIFDLNDFLPANSEWETLLEAFAVNNHGDVVGVGRLRSGVTAGFLFEGFVPAPGTVCIVGLAGVAGLRRRR